MPNHTKFLFMLAQLRTVAVARE